jgi:hypothetical protein
MKKVYLIPFIFGLAGIVFSCLWFFSKKSSDPNLKHFFVPISTVQLEGETLPHIVLQVGEETLPVLLDLGFRGTFSLTEPFFSKIEKKTYLGSQKMYDWRGNEYEKKVYRVPKVGIGSIAFREYTGQEESLEFQQNTMLHQKGGEEPRKEWGKVGWELFEETNLFLDLSSSRIAFCDSLATLEKEGYPAAVFTKVPFDIQRGLIEIEAMTSEGPLLCTLDTGATWNFLHKEVGRETSAEEFLFDPNNITQFSSFKVTGKELGPMVFHHFPIHLPIQVQAMLGIEFFQNYVVFIHFKEGVIYFAPADSFL